MFSQQGDMTSPDDARRLADVEDGIASLFQAIEALGCAVVIITNADKEWVRYSCGRYLPRVADMLTRIHVVSARHFEHVYPNRSVCWKAAAFTHVAKAFFATGDPSAKREIISIGDSNDERLAVRAAAAPLSATPKAIKLVDAPKLLTVACQLQTVAHCLPYLVFSTHAIDVDVAAVLNYAGGAWVSSSSSSPVDKTVSKQHRRLLHLLEQQQNNHFDDPVDLDDDDDDSNDEDMETLLQRIWRDAAWGVLTAIRFQALGEPQDTTIVRPVEPPSTVPRIVSDPTIPAAA